MAKFLYDDLLPSHRVDSLIVSALWRPSDFADIARLTDYARQRNIQLILIGPSVAYDLPLPRLLGILEEKGAGTATANSFADPEAAQLDAQMSALARDQWHVPYISFFENLCHPQQGCPPYAATGVPMLLDSNHLTSAGSIRFAQSMRDRRQLPWSGGID